MSHLRKRRQLVLADGTVFYGYQFGANKEVVGEVVFNTAMTGYQETLSDPSYNGQIITFTYPLIGNYGVNRDDYETIRPSVKALIVREYCDQPSNFRAELTLDQVLQQLDIPGLHGIDTRALTRRIRNYGTIKGIIADADVPVEQLLQKLQADLPTDQIAQVSTKTAWPSAGEGARVVLIDLGMKTNILRELHKRKCDVIVCPHNVSAAEIARLNPDGVMLSNGPGDPQDVPETVETIKALIPTGLPIFGICMGHQLVSLACGAKTYKLKFGHRGANVPVLHLPTGRVDITSQNHGYAVDIESLAATDLELTHISVNDQTCEGVAHKHFPVFSVQYHPEASPGPHDANYLFDQFLANIEAHKHQKAKA